MKKNLVLLVIALIIATQGWGQEDTTKSISDQIKIDRDNKFQEIDSLLKRNHNEVERLKGVLADIDNRNIRDKERARDSLQMAIENRLKILEDFPKAKILFNGQLAFTELLNIQRDIKPAVLFNRSQSFFNQLGNVGKLQEYSDFIIWKAEYDKWYSTQQKNDQMVELINTSLNLVSSTTNNVPLYGSIVHAFSTGISTIFTSWGRKHKNLANQTPPMLSLLHAVSQFESQKSVIDHEWELINKELEQLKIENEALLNEQLRYYGIDYNDFKNKYLLETIGFNRDRFSQSCREAISEKLESLDKEQNNREDWLTQVETYMYKVQSLRLRFGQLTTRMLANLERYEQLTVVYSNTENFPVEFTKKINGFNDSLKSVKDEFQDSYNPAKYIEDSAVMYIARPPMSSR